MNTEIKQFVSDEVYKQTRASEQTLTHLVQDTKDMMKEHNVKHEADLKSVHEKIEHIHEVLDEFKEVYKNNDKANKITAEICKINSNTLGEIRNDIKQIAIDVAPGVKFTKDVMGFAGVINLLKNNLFSVGFLGVAIWWLIKRFF